MCGMNILAKAARHARETSERARRAYATRMLGTIALALALSGKGRCVCLRGRTLAKSFASWPEELMLGRVLGGCLSCFRSYGATATLMRRAAALGSFHTLGCLLICRRANEQRGRWM
jgi:hypothetical protein